MKTNLSHLSDKQNLLPAILVTEALAAIHLAELALKWRMMKSLALSASRRLLKISDGIHEPDIKCRLYVVIWALQKLPYAHTSLVVRAQENLRDIAAHFDPDRIEFHAKEEA